METTKQILNEQHPHWNFFCLKMIEMNECEHGMTFAKECLNLIPGGVDVEATLACFYKRGGHCDCEIIMNIIEPHLDKGAEMAVLDKHIVIYIPKVGSTYDIALSRCDTMAKIDEWSHQLADKNWVTAQTVLNFRKLAISFLK